MASLLCEGKRDIYVFPVDSKEERARWRATWNHREKMRERFITRRLAELRKEIEDVAQRVAVGDKVTYVVESYTCSCWDKEDCYYHLEVTPSQFDIIQKFVSEWGPPLSIAEKIHVADLLRSMRRAPAEINSETAKVDLSFMGVGCDAISYPSCKSVAEWESRQLPDLDVEPQDADADSDEDADPDAEPQSASQIT